MKILLINSGSSSLKFTFADVDTSTEIVASGLAEFSQNETAYQFEHGDNKNKSTLNTIDYGKVVGQILEDLKTHLGLTPEIVGHRVVHGGDFKKPEVITPEIEKRIDELAELAPLHNPFALNAIRSIKAILPTVTQFAVFDTAFHSTIPDHAKRYPIPEKWYSEWKIQRYGFHGLSHAWNAKKALELCGDRADKTVILHLGNGCSATAVHKGKSVETTMGFTPMEGLTMGTRSGSIDPGILLYLLRSKGMDVEKLNTALNKQSGLLGISGKHSDMRQIVESANIGDENAKLAMEIFAYKARQSIGQLSASMGGIDLLVFTGGIGENATEIRGLICKDLEFLGLNLDHDLNENCKPDTCISTPDSKNLIYVIKTQEELMMIEEIKKAQAAA